jgi:curli biogenesis system outer membrane secretion channel CsgG
MQKSSVGCGGLLATALAVALSGCLATAPTVGGGGKGAVSGSAGGATASNEGTLERCEESLGTIGIVEDQNASWYGQYRSQYGQLGSTVPVLRMMLQQSNCFVVVERGGAMRSMQTERGLEQRGDMRAGSNFGAGQMVAADYTMSPSIQFNQDTGGVGAAIGGLKRHLGAFGSFAGDVKQNEASTMLVMIDNRSGVQLAAAEGSASALNFGAWSSAFGSAGAGAANAYTRTPEGKIIVAAFVDSYNQLVKAVRSYKAQTVRGGLGTGGTLGVQGGTTPAARKIR